MKYVEGRPGRIFVIRLEDGDIVHECLERLAEKEDIHAASVIAVGAADKGSRLIVGPEHSRGQSPIEPMEQVLEDASEVAGTGTLFRDEDGRAIVHMHMACGRGKSTITGCIRKGVKVWHIMELVVMEIEGVKARRILDENLGFKLLKPGG